MLAAFRLDPEIIFLLVAAVLAGASKLYEISRTVRKNSLERRKREERRTGVVFEEAPQRAGAPPPPPRESFTLPLHAPAVAVEVALPRHSPTPPPPPPPLPPEFSQPAPGMRRVARRSRAGHRPARSLVRQLRGNRRGLREAVLLREILGPPYALRRAPRRRW